MRHNAPRRLRNNIPQQLQNRQHNIIDITKSRCLKFLRMMKSTGPIYRYIRLFIAQMSCGHQRRASVLLTKLIQPREDRTVVPKVERGENCSKITFGLRGNPADYREWLALCLGFWGASVMDAVTCSRNRHSHRYGMHIILP